jgi:DUF1680 family protein
MRLSPTILLSSTLVLAGPVSAAILAPERVPCAVQDRQPFQDPDRVRLAGWIGSRIEANEANRLVKIDTARLLEGFRKRPGRQSWDGEHVGKWLHAATLAWVNTGDAALRQKLDATAAELIKCQLPDGYLGTYLEKERWTAWDVWAHKYNLIGLMSYMRYTGNLEPLPACRRMGDLLERTFGDTPGKRDIIPAGEHVGMAPTSVLEPMVQLYRLTGEPRYLEFCQYLLRSWEQPNGPHIVSRLMDLKRVDKVGNGKAYEMLSCLNGALEYYRTVGGDRRILDACLIAWQDIVTRRLYLTGAASHGEHFHDDFDLPNVANVGETCVTTTWIQFNAQLLRLTGEARFAEQLERVVLNQLFGAQRWDGSGWGYYVQMEGRKPYSSTLDGHCCLSSGPRGMALIPTFALSTDTDGVVLNLYETGKATLSLKDGTTVTLVTTTQLPSDEHVRIEVLPAKPKAFTVKLRMPAWSETTSLTLNGQAVAADLGPDGYAGLHRQWNPGDKLELRFALKPRVVVGDHLNDGKAAILYGPLVLAADEALLGTGAVEINTLSLPTADLSTLNITPELAPEAIKSWPAARVFRLNAVARRNVGNLKAGAPMEARLIPFADAGSTGTRYKVWLPLRHASARGNLLLSGSESRSRQGNLDGSILDESAQSVVVTFDGQPASEDWYAVALDSGVRIARVVFTHGRNFHDGGWFDASQGKPQVQVQTEKGAPWTRIGCLEDYPATTKVSDAGLKPGARFTLRLAVPVEAVAVRVLGVPASGDNPAQAFSSCGELEAFSP